MRYRAEPPHDHARPERTAVLLVNLGSPAEPTAAATRRYLAEFLWDPRVVEIPRALWWLLLHGIILRTRPAKSAAKYRSIWSPEGSPLVATTLRLAKWLEGSLGERGQPVLGRAAMRYGQPSISAALDALRADGATRILVLPLYPQYAAATTASVWDAVGQWAAGARRVPDLRLVARYGDEPAYIDALAHSVQQHWQREGRGSLLLMSFHGLPARSLALGDPYHCECHATARLLAERLGLRADEYRVTFQSRFGRAKWLEPYAEPTLVELARSGLRRVDVICPGFAADCLETLEEIDQEARAAFLAAGGQTFHYIGCLNDSPAGVQALLAVAQRHLQGWPAAGATPGAADARRAERARSMGASG